MYDNTKPIGFRPLSELNLLDDFLFQEMLAHVNYNDGATKILLYTKGCEGNPSQELRDMLKYIETSTDENVTNQDIDSLHRLVGKVKSRREVGINYMKSWELEQMHREQGIKQGIKQGIRQGIEQGIQVLIPLAGNLIYQEKKQLIGSLAAFLCLRRMRNNILTNIFKNVQKEIIGIF